MHQNELLGCGQEKLFRCGQDKLYWCGQDKLSLFRFGKDKSFGSGQVKVRCGDISGMVNINYLVLDKKNYLGVAKIN